MPTITTLLRLADDSTAPITITRSGPCRQWTVIEIEQKPPRICKHGHIVIGRAAFVDRRGYTRCRYCQQHSKRMSRQRQRGATVTRKG